MDTWAPQSFEFPVVDVWGVPTLYENTRIPTPTEI